jgi:hypothetical protein
MTVIKKTVVVTALIFGASIAYADDVSPPHYQISAIGLGAWDDLRVDTDGNPYKPTFPFLSNLHASDINSNGRIAGTFSTGFGSSNRAYYYDTSSSELNVFGNAFGVTGAYDVNQAGEVLFGLQNLGGGNATLGSLLVRRIDGTVESLGVTTYRKPSFNNNHVVLGQLYNERAFYFSGGVQYDLQSLVVDLAGFSNLSPTDINENGYIVGTGLRNGKGIEFLMSPIAEVPVGPVLSPVPEPETYAMMLAGLGLLGVMTRRRKQKSVA